MKKTARKSKTKSRAVARRQQQAVALPPPTSLLEVIERASRDPTVDVQKMAGLLDLHERVVERERIATYAAAMTACQQEIRTIATNLDNDHTSSRYASYEQIDRFIRPIYIKHGFSLSFNTDESPSGNTEVVRVTCYVTHTCGYSRLYKIDMPADGKGAKGGDVMTKTHATGSAVSYGRRYLVRMIFNIVTGEVDDDGNAAGATDFITESEAADLRALATEIGVNVPAFLKAMRVETFEEIPAKRYKDAVATLEAKRRAT